MKILKGISFLFTALTCFSLPIHAQSTIKGFWNRNNDGNIKLYEIEHGRLEELASTKTGKDGAFILSFYPKKSAYYVVGTGNAGSSAHKYYFYIKNKDVVDITVNDSTYVLNGKNTAENIALSKWHNIVQPVEWKAVYFMNNRSDYEDFFPTLDKALQSVKTFVATPTGNKAFDQLFAKSRDLDLVFFASEFLTTPRSKHPELDILPAFYKEISPARLTSDTRLLDYYVGLRLLTSFSHLYNRMHAGGLEKMDSDAAINFAVNDTIKGERVIYAMTTLKTFIGYNELDSRAGKYILTADQKKRAQDIKNKLAADAAKQGQPAINFTYPDSNGKSVSLSDFKGKVVLVDVWATWCGPCKAEIPSLKKLEEEMHGKDIVIMSVSVDEEKDHQKWKDFIAAEKLGGIQLFASGWSDITKYYDIKGIPRFMVFDKKGNIVNTSAPRPSSKELKLLLESELAK